MVHRVAQETGAGWDIDDMMARMTMRQLTEWYAFFELQHEDTQRAREEAKGGKKSKTPPGRKTYATPEYADLHMRLWANAHKWKGSAKA